MFHSPSRGSDFRDVLNRCVCEATQDVGEVFADRGFESPTAFHNRKDGGYARAGLFAADVDQIRSAKCDRAPGVFGKIGAKLQLRMVEESDESIPDRQRVAARLHRSALGQYRLAHSRDVIADLVEQRWSMLPA